MKIPKEVTDNTELVKKKCEYPGCNKIEYVSKKRGKYCKEHRKKKYRKNIDSNKVKKTKKQQNKNLEENNQILKHKFIEVQTIEMECALDGCGNKFELKVLPRVYIYPKYCPEHINPHRRKMFINESSEM